MYFFGGGGVCFEMNLNTVVQIGLDFTAILLAQPPKDRRPQYAACNVSLKYKLLGLLILYSRRLGESPCALVPKVKQVNSHGSINPKTQDHAQLSF